MPPNPQYDHYKLDRISPYALGEVLEGLINKRLLAETASQVEDITRAHSFNRPDMNHTKPVPAYGLTEVLVAMHVAMRAHAAQYKILDMKRLGLEGKEKELKEQLARYALPNASDHVRQEARNQAEHTFEFISKALAKRPEVPIITPKGVVMVHNEAMGFGEYNTLAQRIFALPYAARGIFNESVYPVGIGAMLRETLGTTTEISMKIRQIGEKLQQEGVDINLKTMIPGEAIAELLPKNAGILNAIAAYSPKVRPFLEANGVDPGSMAIDAPQDGVQILSFMGHRLQNPRLEWEELQEKAHELCQKPDTQRLKVFVTALREQEKLLHKHATREVSEDISKKITQCMENTIAAANATLERKPKDRVNKSSGSAQLGR